MNPYFDLKTKEELILDYKPQEPTREIDPSEITNVPIDTEITYSSPITIIDINRPSFILNNLDIIKNNILAVENILDKSINYGEEKTKLTDDYYSDITSNINLELYKTLDTTLDEVKAVKDTIYNINYDDTSLSTEELIEYDNEIIDKIKSLEESGNTQSINYFSIYVDSQVNKLLSIYSDSITNYTLGLNELLINQDVTPTEDYKDLLTEVFNNTSKLNNYDRNKLDKLNIKDMLVNYINEVYFKKQKVINLLKDSNNLTTDNSFIKEEYQNLLNSSIKELFDLIVELSKVINLNSLYKTDYLNTLTKKDYIKKLYDNG